MSLHNITHTMNNGYSISHYSKIAAAGTKLQPHQTFMGLYFNLSNELHYRISNTLIGAIGKNQFNLVFLPPKLPYQINILHEGRYASLTIPLSYNYLSIFKPSFTRLDRFLGNLNEPRLLSLANLPINEQMMLNLEAILYNTYREEDRDTYITAKVEAIVPQCLDRIRSFSNYLGGHSPQQDVTNILQVHDDLLQNIHRPCSVGLLASKVDMDEKRLEEGFKLCFGTTVYDFHLNCRLKKALAMIRETNRSITDIAAEIGYKNLSNFSEVFKRKYHHSPRALRQENRLTRKQKPVLT